MPDPEEIRRDRAAAAQPDDLASFVHDPSPLVILALLGNRSLSEEHVLAVANRKNLPSEVLAAIAQDRRWSESYPVKLALARNPKTPLADALSLARFLRLFDLAELARNKLISVVFRRKLESMVVERIPAIAAGTKKALARISGGEILIALIKDGYPEVVKHCLENPHLVEANLYKVISRRTTTPGTIRTIAEDRNWSCRYHVKYALVRNEHTPLARTAKFLPDLKLLDLKELFRDPSLPDAVRPLIHRELVERGEDPERLSADEEGQLYEIAEDDLEDIEREVRSYGLDGATPVSDEEEESQDRDDA